MEDNWANLDHHNPITIWLAIGLWPLDSIMTNGVAVNVTFTTRRDIWQSKRLSRGCRVETSPENKFRKVPNIFSRSSSSSVAEFILRMNTLCPIAFSSLWTAVDGMPPSQDTKLFWKPQDIVMAAVACSSAPTIFTFKKPRFDNHSTVRWCRTQRVSVFLHVAVLVAHTFYTWARYRSNNTTVLAAVKWSCLHFLLTLCFYTRLNFDNTRPLCFWAVIFLFCCRKGRPTSRPWWGKAKQNACVM